MSLHPLVGHLDARRRLTQAHTSGRLPQVLLFSGPVGIGKQRLALWLAQLLRCEQPAPEPCGSCRGCRLVLGLAHPDVHWFVPIARPKAGEPDKQVEEAAETLAATMEERRGRPLYGVPDGMASHAVASVRLLQRRAAMTAVERGARVFIIGDAERLVPQESSPEAANALLKLLEEPPPGAYFVLTTTDARRLLPTMRSRAVPLRLGRLTDAEVRAFLAEHLSPAPAPAALDALVAAASGAIGSALGGGEETDKAYRAAGELLEAVLAGPGARMERAIKQAPWQARGDFAAMLDALADTLGNAARGSLGQNIRRPLPPALRSRRDAAALLRAMEHVAEAREAAAGNVNPQLLLATLGEELAEVL
jgi:DNA polymerase III subunit delta'